MYIFEEAVLKIKDAISCSLKELISKQGIDCKELPNFEVEPPTDAGHGDLYSNAALMCARIFKLPPFKIAQMIVSNLNLEGTYAERVEVAGPGFINFSFSQKFFSDVVKQILELKSGYGKNDLGKGKKIMVEFISANPTGPMHMGNARLGALGDCLVEILKTSGYDVYKEFYVNNAGNQIEKFGMSLDVRYRQICLGESAATMPENAYHGDDITELAQEFFDIHKDKYIDKDEDTRKKALVGFALPKNINRMKSDLEKYKIIYDNWFYESDLYQDGEVDKIINILNQKNLTYKKEDALWYKATEFGSEKDEVLVRNNGVPTYFAADIAYHYNKFITRGFDTCIDIWGADHHGHVERMKCAMEALGINKERLHVILVQLVRLVKNGEVVKMSKRSGKSVQLRDLIEEVGADAARFIFNSQESGSGMDFDLDLAVAKNSQNPVYYVQYAHARINSVLKKFADNKLSQPADLSLLVEEPEKKLIYFMALYPREIIKASKSYDSSKITRYAIALANFFHKWYSSCKIVSENQELTHARLELCSCVGGMIKNILCLMNVEAPDYMD